MNPQTLQTDGRRVRSGSAQTRRAFSLIELMIGIVILGLGMVMVASMFPVAWRRARELTEYTNQRTITASAKTNVLSLLHVSAPNRNSEAVSIPLDRNTTSFMGDLLFREQTTPSNKLKVNYQQPINACGGWPSDHWIHALSMENLRVEKRAFVSEDLWRLQDPDGTLNQIVINTPPENPVLAQSYFRPQLLLGQRIFPPLRARREVDETGLFIGADPRWDEELNSRRFVLGVFHRLRRPLDAATTGTQPPVALSDTRVFDVYFVTLRRPKPTARYAGEDPASTSSTPDPCILRGDVFKPTPRPPEEDMLLPVPWRVQVEFPDTIVRSRDAAGIPTGLPTGIPTEITVPPVNMPGNADEKAMIVQMFPPGARFIDEISGQVFKVVKRRRPTPEGDTAILTLDREVVFEDLDMTPLPGNPALCDLNSPILDPCELIRTVWIYPPPVEPRDKDETVLVFDGSQPVVGIEVQTITLAPGD